MTLLMLKQNISTFCDTEVPDKHFGFMYFLFLLTNTFGIICVLKMSVTFSMLCYFLNVMLFELVEQDV